MPTGLNGTKFTFLGHLNQSKFSLAASLQDASKCIWSFSDVLSQLENS